MLAKFKKILYYTLLPFAVLVEAVSWVILLLHKAIKFLQSYFVFTFSFLFLFHFMMLYGAEGKILHLFAGKPVIKKVVDYKTPLYNTLSNDTKWDHLVSCGIYFNELEEMKKTLQCANEKVYTNAPLPTNTQIPRCFVVSTSSPDVYNKRGFNFLPLVSVFGSGAVVGYFDTNTDTVFVVENHDAASIYRHELQHYFLKLKGGTGGGHHQDIWKLCEPPYYNESDKVKIINKLERLEKLEEMVGDIPID